jgi:hypothetical protein
MVPRPCVAIAMPERPAVVAQRFRHFVDGERGRAWSSSDLAPAAPITLF